MILKKLFSLLFLLGLGYSTALAQRYNIKTYSVNDGLPSSQVYDVHIDDLGFVWFATTNGLVKYDGHEYELFDTDHGLKDALIYDLYEDMDQDFWVSTEIGGVAKFENDSLFYIPELSRLDTMVVNYMINSPDGELWFGTDKKGVIIWDKKSKTFEQLTKENGLPSDQIWDIMFDTEGTAWISTMYGVGLYTTEKGVFKTYTKEKDNLSGENTYQVYETTAGKKWIATNEGITKVGTDGEITTLTEVNGERLGYIYSVVQDNDGTVWIGTESNGLIWCDGGNYTHITRKNGLSSNFIYRLIKADDGTVWVATDGNGVSIFKDKQFMFYDSRSPLGADFVSGMLKARDGTIWLGTENGLSSYKDGKFRNYTIQKDLFNESEIWDIEELPNGHLLLLTYNYEIIEFDGSRFFKPAFYDDIYPYYVSDIHADMNGDIWFAAFETLLKYSNGKLTKFDPPKDNYWRTALSTLYRDSRGDLWVGTEGGVARFNGLDFEFLESGNKELGKSIYQITEDHKGNIWLGTNKGITIVSGLNETGRPPGMHAFDLGDVYMDETMFIQFDDYGGMWHGTNAGINYYDLRSESNKGEVNQLFFPLQDYGNGVEMNGSASLITNEGELWFGTASKGIVTFHFDNEKGEITRNRPPTIFLREILANNESVFDQSSNHIKTELQTLELEYEQNNLELIFNGIDFKDPGRVRYRYQMEGVDDEWHMGADLKNVRYTNLEPGAYEFKVSAKSIKSAWSEPANLITINVKKPFWATYWFYALAALSVIGVVIAYVNMRVNQIEKKNLKKQVDEKTKTLQNALNEKEVLIKEIHHRVKNNLAVVSGLLELQSWSMNDGHAKDALQESRLRVLAMSKIHENLYQNDDLARVNFKKFLEDLVRSVTATMKKAGQDITVFQYVDEVLLDVNIGIPVGLITNELVSNSYKHAFDEKGEGTITVTFEEKEDKYLLIVEDNGVGSDENILEIAKGSLGMNLIRSLVSQINSDITFDGKNGARFELNIWKK